MSKHMVRLARGEHEHVFRYDPGQEEQIVDEIMRQAAGPRAGLDWLGAATLAFEVAQGAAIDCCVAVTPPPAAAPSTRPRSAGSDDAKDGPCTSFNCS